MKQHQLHSTVESDSAHLTPDVDVDCQGVPGNVSAQHTVKASNRFELDWNSELFEPLAGHGRKAKTKCPVVQTEESIDGTQLSRRILRLLRHVPEEECLSMDRNGWVDSEQLSAVIGGWCSWCDGNYSTLQADSLSPLILQLGLEHRVQFDGQFCRATYGHSTRFYRPSSVAEPNVALFDGTNAANWPLIECFGLWPMRRRFVQLTTDREYAQQIAASKQAPLVLKILSTQAVADGIQFVSTGSHVWLAEPIPAHLLQGWLADAWDFRGSHPPFNET